MSKKKYDYSPKKSHFSFEVAFFVDKRSMNSKWKYALLILTILTPEVCDMKFFIEQGGTIVLLGHLE
ncbi:MAG: hypothetical protein ACPGRC_02595 [Salibacteraceae bacterium]